MTLAIPDSEPTIICGPANAHRPLPGHEGDCEGCRARVFVSYDSERHAQSHYPGKRIHLVCAGCGAELMALPEAELELTPLAQAAARAGMHQRRN